MTKTPDKWAGIIQTIGPGILYAGAAVGTSHLLQSTRAGAEYGFSLIGLVLLVFLFKYPAFEFSYRYTTATRQSLLDGYLKQGRWALMLFLVIILVSSVIAVTALTAVTAALAGSMLGPFLSGGRHVAPVVLNLLLLSATSLILAVGKYAVLDRAMKLMMSALAIITILAVALAFGKQTVEVPVLPPPELWTAGGLTFMLALMGWMPTPVDASAFTSLWLRKRTEQTGHEPTMKEALIDFNVGYLSSAFLAVAFVLLGALVMYGTGEKFSASSVVFAGQLTGLYTRAIGEWGRWLVSFIAFITMFSTVLTVFDGYTITLRRALGLLFPGTSTVAIDEERGSPQVRPPVSLRLVFPMLVVAAFVLASYYGKGIRAMVDFAAVTAFLTAPVLAWLNYRAVTSDDFPEDFRPGRGLHILALSGIAFLVVFGIAFLWSRCVA